MSRPLTPARRPARKEKAMKLAFMSSVCPKMDLPGLLNADSSQQVSQLLGAVDVSGMAARLGIDTGMAGAGIAALIPQFLGLIKDQGLGRLVSMLGKGGMGGVASLAKGLFH